MSPMAPANWSANVTVRFVRHPPSGDAVRFARLCAKERWLSGTLTVIVENNGDDGAPQHEIRIARPGQNGVVHRGPDLGSPWKEPSTTGRSTKTPSARFETLLVSVACRTRSW